MLKSIAALLVLAAVLLFPRSVFAQATASIAGSFATPRAPFFRASRSKRPARR